MFNLALSAAPEIMSTTMAAADGTLTAASKLADKNMGITDSVITALLGYSVVFVGLVLLMLVITAFGKIMSGKKKQAAQPAAASASAPAAPAAASDIGMRDGSRVCDLHGVDDKTAAMIMAIVAEQTGIPLNELRFISIKEM